MPLLERIRTYFRERKGSRLVIILHAAVLLELFAIVQYIHTRDLLREEQERMSQVSLTLSSDAVSHTLEEAETTMWENTWSIRQSLACPDSLFGAAVRMMAHNPRVNGACIAVVPDYYPQKGRLFEPYAHKEDGVPVVEQIAGPDHDYTLGPDYQRGLREEKAFWGDPYEYGEDPVLKLSTYTYPIRDWDGRVAAVCGLDIDLTWLSDSLNTNHYYPSSFCFLVTGNGKLVAGPAKEKVPPETVAYVMDLMADTTVVRLERESNRIHYIKFRDPVTREKAYVDYSALERDPHWVVAHVTYDKDVLVPVESMMWKILLLNLASLALLIFIINRFALNGKKLWEADMKEAHTRSELRIASRIQEEMLPQPLPEQENLVVQGSLVPAKEVGGDLYDYHVRDGKLFFCIGDVSGKGVPAAIVMSAAKTLFRSVSDREDDPARMVQMLNREACRQNRSGVYVTFFLGVLDLSEGVLRYCNAGHDHPFLVREKAEEVPAVANIPIGIFNDFAYQAQETAVAPGSVLFLYTDGVTEAKNGERRLYGRKRLADALTSGGRAPEALIHGVMDDIRSFTGDAEQSDDITMLVIRYGGPVEPGKETD